MKKNIIFISIFLTLIFLTIAIYFGGKQIVTATNIETVKNGKMITNKYGHSDLGLNFTVINTYPSYNANFLITHINNLGLKNKDFKQIIAGENPNLYLENEYNFGMLVKIDNTTNNEIKFNYSDIYLIDNNGKKYYPAGEWQKAYSSTGEFGGYNQSIAPNSSETAFFIFDYPKTTFESVGIRFGNIIETNFYFPLNMDINYLPNDNLSKNDFYNKIFIWYLCTLTILWTFYFKLKDN